MTNQLGVQHPLAQSEVPSSKSGNRPEALRGNLAGYHSIRVNDQWRVVFRWKDGAAHEALEEGA